LQRAVKKADELLTIFGERFFFLWKNSEDGTAVFHVKGREKYV